MRDSSQKRGIWHPRHLILSSSCRLRWKSFGVVYASPGTAISSASPEHKLFDELKVDTVLLNAASVRRLSSSKSDGW